MVDAVLPGPAISFFKSVYPAPYLVHSGFCCTTGTCETAHTYTGRIIGGTDLLVCPVTCKRWSCPYCSRVKIRRLACLCKLAGPTRLLTLTVDPANYTSPRHAFDATAALVPELIRSLRKKFGAVEYLRVTELHKSGFPHYHMLIRSGFLPHAVVKNEWHRLTNNAIVDLRQVDGSFQSYTYLTKYLSKLHRIEWTDRHVSYSKSFFPVDAMKKPDSEGLADGKMYKSHPFVWLAEYCPGREVIQQGPMTFLVTDYVPDSIRKRQDDF